ncbi:winged helix-turn-helix transcriptional regulator [Liquorilactobacillus satsumensis]|uniref:winged helix-turn-helix transcriptional regulator n=1 Tax=Liquorilactobacillus satsumensis TaxID=259059 RepID=UPI0021C39EAD|nr:helix-turn-helix domain-containing protein [Liquorilactobacillus satsumensis]MCP9327910.1 helix-turn-helix transcriptional regulator [Liquorilactobacillus satsumensis]
MRTINAIESSQKHFEYCPLDTTLGILSGKWKSIIICRLMSASLHFSELHKEIPRCSTRMLALQLSELQEDQIIERQVTATFHTEYSLTAWGQSLAPLVTALNSWGSHYLKENAGKIAGNNNLDC